jgi:murein DD-endopeptidase MepM/ murein hydrolase activator NlpD
MTRDRLRPAVLARRILLPPLLAGLAVTCLLVVLAAGSSQGAKASNPLAGLTVLQQVQTDLEGTPSAVDIRRALKPLSERKRLLAAHPYFALYKLAKRRFGVPWLLVAAVHYQETGFGRAPDALAHEPAWYRHKQVWRGIARPARYPNRSSDHPSIRDDFDVVMSIGAELRAAGARGDLGPTAARALEVRYGTDPAGRLSAAMITERARAWKVLGVLPLPGRGELAPPVAGIGPGCGYFGCPRPGHLHNGIDILAPTGTPIHAADAGTVAVLESIGESGGYGNFVCLQHRPHLATCYAHLSAVAAGLRLGSQVKRGEVIGLVGQTGSATAPHLHFEVRRGPAACQSCAVDPAPLLDGEVPQAIVPAMVGLADRLPAYRAATRAATGPAAGAPLTGSSQDEQDTSGEHDDQTLDGLRPPAARTPALPARRPQPAPSPQATTGTATQPSVPAASTPPAAAPESAPAPESTPPPASSEAPPPASPPPSSPPPPPSPPPPATDPPPASPAR